VVIEIGEQEVCTIETLDRIIARLRTVSFLDKILPRDHNDLVDAIKCIRDILVAIRIHVRVAKSLTVNVRYSTATYVHPAQSLTVNIPYTYSVSVS